MALSLAEILAAANKISGFSETDVTDYLKNVIHDLERDSIFLESLEEITLVEGQRNYSLSSLTKTYRKPFHIQPKNSSQYFEELTEVSFEEYRDRLLSNSGSSRPLVFSVHNEIIYLDPPPLAATYTKLDIWGKIEHGDSVETILYPEKYREMLSNGCAWQIFKRYGLTDEQKARDARDLYEDQKNKFIVRNSNSRHHKVRYNDL